MKYRTMYDDIDPDVVPEENEGERSAHPSSDDQYVIGEDGRKVVNIELSVALGRKVEKPKSWVKPSAAVLGVLFLGLTAWNVFHFTHPTLGLPTPTPFQIKQALYLGALRVEAYRKVHGVVPDTLSQAGLPEDAGYTYKRAGAGHYRLSFERGGPGVQYDDATMTLDAYFGSPKTMLAMGGSR